MHDSVDSTKPGLLPPWEDQSHEHPSKAVGREPVSESTQPNKRSGEIHSSDVMAVIVVATSVTRQYRTRRAKLVTSKSKGETAQTEAQGP